MEQLTLLIQRDEHCSDLAISCKETQMVLQTFKDLERRDPQLWTEKPGIVCSTANGGARIDDG